MHKYVQKQVVIVFNFLKNNVNLVKNEV